MEGERRRQLREAAAAAAARDRSIEISSSHESVVSFLTCPREPVRPITFMTIASLMGPSCERKVEVIRWRERRRGRRRGSDEQKRICTQAAATASSSRRFRGGFRCDFDTAEVLNDAVASPPSIAAAVGTGGAWQRGVRGATEGKKTARRFSFQSAIGLASSFCFCLSRRVRRDG